MTTARVGDHCTLFWEDKKALHDHLAHPLNTVTLELVTGSRQKVLIEVVPDSEMCFYGNDKLHGKRKRLHGCLVYATVNQGPRKMALAAYDCAYSKLVVKVIDDDEGRREILEFPDLATCHERL